MKKWLAAGFCIILLLLCGCGTDEVENNAFPMAMGVELDDAQDFRVYMAYPNLQEQDAKENAVSADAFWSGAAGDLFAGADEMSENSNKNVDFNHLKVLVLTPDVLENDRKREELISFFMENKDAAWNTYVMFSFGDLSELFSDEVSPGSSLGIYLEDMVEEWTNVRGSARATVGDLMSQYFNGNETLLVPVVSVEEKRPETEGFAVVKDLRCVSVMDRTEAYETMLIRSQLKSFSFATQDDVRVTLHLISVEKEITQESSERLPQDQFPLMEITIRAAAQTKNRVGLSEKEKQQIRRRAERELAARLQELADRQRERYHVDVADSFVLLPGYHRGLWKLYGSNRDAYEKKLRCRIRVELSKDEQGV